MNSYRPDRINLKGGVKERAANKAREKVQAVLGRKLKSTEIVHHVDGNPFNNENQNLVLCPDEAYHRLLHVRMDSLESTGRADLRKCNICKGYSHPTEMYERRNQFTHFRCQREKALAYYYANRVLRKTKGFCDE